MASNDQGTLEFRPGNPHQQVVRKQGPSKTPATYNVEDAWGRLAAAHQAGQTTFAGTPEAIEPAAPHEEKSKVKKSGFSTLVQRAVQRTGEAIKADWNEQR